MKSVTLDEFKRFRPCWLNNKAKAAKLEEIGKRRDRWTALDILNLSPDEVSVADKLWAVLRPELIEEVMLHEFACRCAEDAWDAADYAAWAAADAAARAVVWNATRDAQVEMLREMLTA